MEVERIPRATPEAVSSDANGMRSNEESFSSRLHCFPCLNVWRACRASEWRKTADTRWRPRGGSLGSVKSKGPWWWQRRRRAGGVDLGRLGSNSVDSLDASGAVRREQRKWLCAFDFRGDVGCSKQLTVGWKAEAREGWLRIARVQLGDIWRVWAFWACRRDPLPKISRCASHRDGDLRHSAMGYGATSHVEDRGGADVDVDAKKGGGVVQMYDCSLK